MSSKANLSFDSVVLGRTLVQDCSYYIVIG